MLLQVFVGQGTRETDQVGLGRAGAQQSHGEVVVKVRVRAGLRERVRPVVVVVVVVVALALALARVVVVVVAVAAAAAAAVAQHRDEGAGKEGHSISLVVVAKLFGSVGNDQLDLGSKQAR